MKIHKKPGKWEYEPWTIVLTTKFGQQHWYAFNIRTGERKPIRFSYGAAMEDIPGMKSPTYAEPWGV